jgi:hypothetical protein
MCQALSPKASFQRVSNLCKGAAAQAFGINPFWIAIARQSGSVQIEHSNPFAATFGSAAWNCIAQFCCCLNESVAALAHAINPIVKITVVVKTHFEFMAFSL